MCDEWQEDNFEENVSFIDHFYLGKYNFWLDTFWLHFI